MSTWHGKVEFNPYAGLIHLLVLLDIKAAKKLTKLDIAYLHLEMKLRTKMNKDREALTRDYPDFPELE